MYYLYIFTYFFAKDCQGKWIIAPIFYNSAYKK